MTIAEKIKFLREKKELTQTELANKAGIHPVSVRKYETNKMTPTLAQIYKLAKALGVHPTTLMDEVELKAEYKTVGDIIMLIKTLDDVVGLKIDGERDENQVLKPESIIFSLSNNLVNDALANWEVARHDVYSHLMSAYGRDFALQEALDYDTKIKHKEITELSIASMENDSINDTESPQK